MPTTDLGVDRASLAEEIAQLKTGPLAIIGGCGHVGLPLGMAFARQGYQVDLIDTCTRHHRYTGRRSSRSDSQSI
jgi:hypothetical protein